MAVTILYASFMNLIGFLIISLISQVLILLILGTRRWVTLISYTAMADSQPLRSFYQGSSISLSPGVWVCFMRSAGFSTKGDFSKILLDEGVNHVIGKEVR